MNKTVRDLTLIFIIGILLAFLLIVVAYSFPTENAYANVVKDASYFSKNLHPSVIPGYDTTKLDLYTDSEILSQVSYYNKSISLIDNSMIVYSTIGKNFTKYADGDFDNNVLREYPRYWHGYLAVYKPLYNFLDYNAVKVLELAFEIVMIAGIIRLMFENNLKNYIVPFILSIMLIHPEVIGLSMQYFAVFNITLISVYALIRFKDYILKDNRFFYYLFIIGMVTNYFDYLTYPLITLGIPVIFYLLLDEDRKSLRDNVLMIILFGVTWAVGYAGMWLSKWVISSVILNENIVADGFNRFLLRSSGGDFTRFDAVLKNVFIYKKRAYLIIGSLILIYYIKRLIGVRNDISMDRLRQAAPFLILALTPFVWYFIASNHSYIHYWMTYRTLFIFFFAILCSFEFLAEARQS
ncbi:hypothetical protein [Methanobrevibacter sp.]|uniref:hypothetical protein n=1 Tax=Methanobrevibacter sp. TaxID=66852 RepID=UPI00388F5560